MATNPTDIHLEIQETAVCIGELITCKPNASQLREKQNRMKKLLRSVSSFQRLLQETMESSNVVAILVLIQSEVHFLHSVGEDSGLLKNDDINSLIELLLTASRAGNVLYGTCFRLIGVLILNFLRPPSLLGYLGTSLAALEDKSKLLILEEVIHALVKRTVQTRLMVSSWADELCSLLIDNQLWDVLELWLPYMSGRVLADSGFLTNKISVSQISSLEGVLTKCCDKSELHPYLFRIIQGCVTSNVGAIVCVGLRLLGERSLACKKSDYVQGVSESLTLLKQTPVHMMSIMTGNEGFELIESYLSASESIAVYDWDVFLTLVKVTVYPISVEQVFACRHRRDMVNRQTINTDDPNELFRERFLQLRSDVRQILRKGTVSNADSFEPNLVELYKASYDWRDTEAIVHAASALNAKCPGFINHVVDISNGRFFNQSVHRALLTTVVVCLTAYACVEPSSFVLPFVLHCLSKCNTLDTQYGWFDFRSKQDNSCVVYLQMLGGRNGAIDVPTFINLLSQHMQGIKTILYKNDPFIQSRYIFIQSVARIVSIGKYPTEGLVLETLQVALQQVCENVTDVQAFISACPSEYGSKLVSVLGISR